jgi:amino acid transporter
VENSEIKSGEKRENAAGPSLRTNYLSFIENAAQMLGGIAPAGTIGVVLPLLILRGGNATWLIFLVTLLAFSLVLICINRFSELSASAGALSTFAEAGLGRRAGVVAGWAYIATMVFSVAGTAPSSAYYADLVLTQITGDHGSLLRWALLTAGVGTLAWAVAHRDIKLSTEVTLAIEVSTVAVMMLIVALAAWRTRLWADPAQFHLKGTPLAGVQVGLAFGFITLAGFETVTTLGDETRQATRTIPRAIETCLLPVGLLYLVMIYFLVALSRKHGLAFERMIAPFDSLAREIRHPEMGLFSSLGIALSYFACTLACMNAGARVIYSMGRRGFFARSFGRAHPVNATPSRAIGMVALLGLVIPVALLWRGKSLLQCVNLLTQLAAFGFIASYFLVCLAMPFYLRKRGLLRMVDGAAAGAALMILGIVLALSLLPLPPAPWRYLPYIFLASIIVGILASAIFWRKNRGLALPHSSSALVESGESGFGQ